MKGLLFFLYYFIIYIRQEKQIIKELFILFFSIVYCIYKKYSYLSSKVNSNTGRKVRVKRVKQTHIEVFSISPIPLSKNQLNINTYEKMLSNFP